MEHTLTGERMRDREIARQVVESCNGNKSDAARKLGVTRSKIRRLLRTPKTQSPVERYDPAQIENEQLRVKLKHVSAALREAREQRYYNETFQKFAEDAIKVNRGVPEWAATRGRPSSDTVAMTILSDVHYPEVIQPDEVFGMNAYNTRIAEMRIRNYFEGVVRISKEVLTALNIQGVVMGWLGDMLSGDIHDELRETNELPTFEALLRLSEQLEAGVRMVADEMGAVHVVGVPGNHGRTTKKPRMKRAAEHSVDWLLYRIVAKAFENDPRVTFDIGVGKDHQINVLGWKYHITHGDQARGGSGISGDLTPLSLLEHRKRKWTQQTGRPFDYLVTGHWHRFRVMGDVIVNGSVVGYNEYSLEKNFPYQPPQQAYWITHPKWGVVYPTPIFVEDEKEGWRTHGRAAVAP